MFQVCAKTILLVVSAVLFGGCARNLAESFSAQGFRLQRVVFVSDHAEIQLTDQMRKPIAWVRDTTLAPQVVVQQLAGRSLAGWGQGCEAEFQPKHGVHHPRMGIIRNVDGWDVADAASLRDYGRATGTEYLVVLNKVRLSRAELDRVGGGAVGRAAFVDADLDLSIIDARTGRRVWKEVSTARVERRDSLELLVHEALDLAADNFFISLPMVRRWGCREVMDRFQ